MIKEPYKDIQDSISLLMDQLIDSSNTYQVVHSRRIARTVQTFLNQKPKGKLLELGTSAIVPIMLSHLAPELEVHVTNFDLDQPTLGEMTLSMGIDSVQVPTYRVDLETQALPVEDNIFDYVLCCEVIEHMELDPMFMISEINRVLKPGGTLILTTPNITSSRAIWKILRGLEPYFYMQYRHSPELYRHNYEYSPYAITQVLKAGGFDGSVWTEDSFEDGVTEDIEKLRSVGYNMSNLGDNIFVVAKKVNTVINRYPAVIYAD
jgi:2-polyprenyl-3-methyl-5-hydroxy-6-metoxy-1,4-benzoquinol methylase